MIQALSRPVRRLLAVGLLAAVLLAAEVLVLGPVRDWRAASEARLAGSILLLARTRAALAAVEAAPPAPPAAASDTLLLQATDDTLAAALLQGLLRAAADAEGISLATVQIEPAVPAPGVRRIALTASFTAAFAPLLGLLHRLESGQPLVRVLALELQAADTGADPALAATITVAALLREKLS
jgi:hypothetical protein